MRRVEFLFVFLILSISSCGFFSNSGSDGKTDQDVVQNSKQVPFPHPENFKELNQHGFLALDDETKASCSKCHVEEINLSEAQPNTAGSCYQCHSNYPHAWGSLKEHGPLAIQDIQSCYKCHNSPLNLAANSELEKNIPPTCSSCHAGYPHPSGWQDRENLEFHGTAVIKDGADTCKVCHGEDLQGGEKAGSCSTCHTAYPHKEMEKNHRSVEFALTKDKADASCQQCHVLSKQVNVETVKIETFKNQSCQSCHKSYPHAIEGWLDKSSVNFHGTLGKKEDFVSCKGCHGEDFRGNGRKDKDCFECHDGYPHTDEWKTTRKHGEQFVLQKFTEKVEGVQCYECHGADLQGNNNTKDCNSCHKAYPRLHEEEFKGEARGGHSLYIKDHVEDKKKTCSNCHTDGIKVWKRPRGCSQFPCHGSTI